MKSAVLLVLIAVLALAGCLAGSGTRARIKEKTAAYAALTAAQQAKVAEGVVEVGFTMDMVYMALGRAHQVQESNLPEGRETIWTYRNIMLPSTMSALTVNPPGQSKGKYSPGMNAASIPINAAVTKGFPAPSVDSLPDPAVETLHVIFLNGVVFELKLAR